MSHNKSYWQLIDYDKINEMWGMIIPVPPVYHNEILLNGKRLFIRLKRIHTRYELYARGGGEVAYTLDDIDHPRPVIVPGVYAHKPN